MRRYKLFSGNSHPELTKKICEELNISQGKCTFLKFSNENFHISLDEDVRGNDIYVVQTAAPPLHDHIMELLILIDTLRYAGAYNICAILPYMPYVRSDKYDDPGSSVTARLMASLLETAGASSAILLDLHTRQEQAFFRIPTQHLSAQQVLIDYLRQHLPENPVLVAPDAGEVKDLVPFTEALRLPMAVIDKRRVDHTEHPIPMGIVGDIRDKTAILIDDEIASGGTIASSAHYLHECGAKKIWALCTHPVFSGNATEKIQNAPIDNIVVTDTIPLPPEKRLPNLTVLSIAHTIANAIRRSIDF